MNRQHLPRGWRVENRAWKTVRGSIFHLSAFAARRRLSSIFVCLCAWCFSASAQNTAVIGSASYTNMLLVATTPTKLYSVTGYNSGPSQFVQVFETNAPPVNGAIPVFSIPVSSGQYFDFDFSYYGADLDSIVVCNSTSGNSLALGSSNCGIQAIIKNIPMTGARPVPTGH